MYIEVKSDGRTSVVTGVVGVTLFTNTWYYVGLTRSTSGNITVLLDGNPYPMGNCIGDITPSQDLCIGVHRNEDFFLQQYGGTIDEVRISKIARSSEWISTEYNNQNDPATFCGFGSEVQR